MKKHRHDPNIPVRFQDKTLDDYEITDGYGDPNARDFVAKYIDAIDTMRENGRGLLLVGPPGLGKTMLACVVLNAALDKGYKGNFIPFAEYVQMLLTRMDYRAVWDRYLDEDYLDRWEGLTHRIKRYRNQDFLVLDDVGKEHSTDTKFAENTFDRLLRYRFNKGLPTILTSNLAVAKWSARYHDSMVSFLDEAYDAIRVGDEETKDYRRRL